MGILPFLLWVERAPKYILVPNQKKQPIHHKAVIGHQGVNIYLCFKEGEVMHIIVDKLHSQLCQ